MAFSIELILLRYAENHHCSFLEQYGNDGPKALQQL